MLRGRLQAIADGVIKNNDQRRFPMNSGNSFVDYYAILQVDPNCDLRTLETAYRYLAKIFHPDHIDTADVTKFNEVIQAYRAIRDPSDRDEYDLIYARATGFDFNQIKKDYSEQKTAVSDADVHARILMFLYKRRRENSQDAGVGRYFVQEMLNSSDENFEFHIWYLKSKGFIETTEQGTLAITIDGVDHVISMSRTAIKDPLRIEQSSDYKDEAKL